MNPKLWIGVVISAVLLWLSAKDVDFQRAWEHVEKINAIYLVPYLALVAAEVIVRAARWQVLLAPVKRCSFQKLNSATLIGLMANNVLPARAGEFVRAYVGGRMEQIPFSTCFATVVIDRVLDGLIISAIFILAVVLRPVPDFVKAPGYAAAGVYLVALGFLFALLVREAATLRLVGFALRYVPARFGDFVLRVLQTFVHGLHVLRSAQLLVLAIALCVGVWIVYALTFHVMWQAFGIPLSLVDAFLVLSIVSVAITLPSTPGFVGTMQAAIVFSMGFLGIDQSEAFAFAVVYHIFQYVPITLGGIIALWLERLTLGEIAGAPTGVEA